MNTECLSIPRHPQTQQILPSQLYTVGPLIVESPLATKRVSTETLEAFSDPLAVRTKISKQVEFLYILSIICSACFPDGIFQS